MYCWAIPSIGLSTNTSSVRKSATSPETSRTSPFGVSLGVSTKLLIRFWISRQANSGSPASASEKSRHSCCRNSAICSSVKVVGFDVGLTVRRRSISAMRDSTLDSSAERCGEKPCWRMASARRLTDPASAYLATLRANPALRFSDRTRGVPRNAASPRRKRLLVVAE